MLFKLHLKVSMFAIIHILFDTPRLFCCTTGTLIYFIANKNVVKQKCCLNLKMKSFQHVSAHFPTALATKSSGNGIANHMEKGQDRIGWAWSSYWVLRFLLGTMEVDASS